MKKIVLILLMFIAVIGLTGCSTAGNAKELKQEDFYNDIQNNDYKKYIGNYYKISGTVNLIESNDIRIYGINNLQFKIVFKNSDEIKKVKATEKYEFVGKIKEIHKIDNKPTTIVVEDGRLSK